MNLDQVATLAQTLLYEGYLLYPYRASSVKNRHRWLFGTLYPRQFVETQDESDRWWMQTECVVQGTDASDVTARVRFLHITETGTAEYEVDSPPYRLEDLIATPQTTRFGFEAANWPRTVEGGSRSVRPACRGWCLYGQSGRPESDVI